MTSNVASSVRPNLRESRHPSSPHTPSRFISSTYSSPGSTYRQEEDAIVIEIGARSLKAGFEGDPGPQCTITFDPDESRRIGDYRAWAPGRKCQDEDIHCWSDQYELWRPSLEVFDLGLMEDKIERAVREAYNKFLLTDAGSARLILVLPSVLPHPLLSSLLSTLFNRWKYSSITLLPNPATAAVAAGLRSALVVDIGWHETIATAVFEHREIGTTRTTRAMKALTQELGRHLTALKIASQCGFDESTAITLVMVEEVIARLVSCKPDDSRDLKQDEDVAAEVGGLTIAKDSPEQPAPTTQQTFVDIDWPTGKSSKVVTLPVATLSQPLEAAFFAPETPEQQQDDHEWSLLLLVFRALLALPPDARALCMSRIVFIGGGSNIPGLTSRIMTGVGAIVTKHGWSAVRGKPVEQRRERLKELGQGRTGNPSARHGVPEPPGKDYVEERRQKQASKDHPQQVLGVLRQVESLGSWAGASLLASLKVRGFVEIERERYLSHGLNGAHRDVEISVVPQRQSMYGPGILKTGGERSSWTLAGWA